MTINANNTLDVEHGGSDGNGGATLDGVQVTDNGALDVGDVAPAPSSRSTTAPPSAAAAR